MPAPETDYRFQKAQLWRRVSSDRHGNPTISAREELTVRWEDKEIQVIGPNGQPINLSAMVVVLCDVEQGSIMWKGCEDQLPEGGVPTRNLMEVVTIDNIPDVKARNYRKVLGLRRYNNRLPTIIS